MSLSVSVSKFIEKERLFLPQDHLLCTVSGGPDSMAMLEILRSLGYSLKVAHVNYMLRDQDSDQDQNLVESYCERFGIEYFVKQLSDREVSDLKAGNLQEKARHIRYQWFETIRKQCQAAFICVAHHQMDVAETFLLHALRSAGISGLKSIQSKNNYIRRPLLSSDPSDLLRVL